MKFLRAVYLVAQLVTASSLLRPIEQRDAPVSYDGHHVYSITPTSRQEANSLVKRFEEYPSHFSHNDFVVVIPRSEVASFNALNLNTRLINSDLGKSIRAADKPSLYKRSALQGNGTLPDPSWFDTYHAYADHLQYWDDLVAALPNNWEKFSIGASYENRTIWAYHLFGDRVKDRSGNAKAQEKPVILWHATVHAREWISTAVIEYLAYQLVDGYQKGDEEVVGFLDTYDFYLVPFHNPDGFVYTQTTDRLWRKNRQPRPNTTCIGTDGNRNWAFQWNTTPPDGTAPAGPCGQTFGGLSAGDTPENRALSTLSQRLSQTTFGIRSFIDWHSYGQQVGTPFGYTCESFPHNIERMLVVANGTARAIEAASTRGSVYESGVGCQIIYFSAGNSRDIHYGVWGASHSWTLELSPKEASEGGFVLPPEQIWPVVREQWAGQRWTLGNVTVD
ncbi:hypothetical protein DM02DRAFT_399898 [Periconia macrospinosa]|uniref:Peptidase M14 domain-containing protein n=1 Tax=Periconia macrospinosa TaxID=97972 RepID=A0A2V1CYM5_9PLEO|nr:hypothetical protein DM02DRAFT_399898 [Periconia macrospinosa]